MTEVVTIAASSMAKKFGSLVVERWTRHRAERFFDSLVNALGAESNSGIETTEIDDLLQEILSDETKSEVLFEGYRRVCLSKSKTIGPRIIGLLTAKLIYEKRMANDSEECIFAAAEDMSDVEFVEFMKEYHKRRTLAMQPVQVGYPIHRIREGAVSWTWEDTARTSAFTPKEHDIGPLDLAEELGTWAVKLKQSGLLVDGANQRLQLQQNPGSDAVAGFTTSVAYTITLLSGCAQLDDLLQRSIPSDAST